MIIAGAILLTLGIGATIYGFYLNNSVEAQLNALFSNGNVDPGTVWIVAGIISLVIGIVLLIIGLTKKAAASPSIGIVRSVPRKPEPDSLCPHCGKGLEGSPAFCPFCGKSTNPVNPKKDTFCPYCESILPSGTAFCPAWGKQVGSEPGPAKRTFVPTPTKSVDPSAEPSVINGWSLPADSDL